MEASASTPGAAAHHSDVFDIQKIFNLASKTHEACDAKAKELFGGQVEPVRFPGACSYNIYAGRALEFVVQFRLESQPLKTEKSRLARDISGSLVPKASFVGKLREDGGEKQQIYVYGMNWMHGIRHLYFKMGHGFPPNTSEKFVFRETLMKDIAHFMALSWKAPQAASLSYRDRLRQTYVTDLGILYTSLPPRFRPPSNSASTQYTTFSLYR